MSTTCNEMAFFTSNFMLQTQQEDDNQPPPSLSPLLPSCNPQDFHGVASFLGKRSMAFSGVDHVCNNEETNGGEDDLSDDGSQAGLEKKRRLNMEQVKTLEKSFELGNKLEPERKMQLARALGLQPRQVAIWFQNRRARWKTKQLEKDYDLLKRQFEALKAENDALQSQNQKLQAEILALKSREPAESINLNIKETEGSSSNRSENSSDDIKLDISTTAAATESPLSSRPFFPSSSARPPPPTVAQFFSTNNNPTRPEIQFYKTNNNEEIVKEENSFNNMLQICGIDDQSGSIWPWLEQQHFN